LVSRYAQGEGAIEGTLADYKIASPFATNFLYSRFDLLAAAPRDISKLSGKRRPKTSNTGKRAASGSSVPVDMVEV